MTLGWFREFILDIIRRTPRETIKKIRNRTIDFIDFCIKFRTLHIFKGSTEELSNERIAFDKFLSQERPFRIKNFDRVVKVLSGKAISLQRLLDLKHKDTDDRIDDIVDWFIDQKEEIEKIFSKYLK